MCKYSKMFNNKVYPQQIEIHAHTHAHAEAHADAEAHTQAHTQADADAEAQAWAYAQARSQSLTELENERDQLECINGINSDYGYAQTYFYVFMFICLITGIIIFG
jgi:hypothetical protein